ncbi:uncharacterized protein LOC109809673 [Cajanus cajan]|uniref:Uncharacterized protein n=1 Tax=Cajanus cajan TaxID=3821 RepID=A0A151SLD4_CAJCA|nr:uncharacterized protein LOC109809673 [Cajanus cajan]KYP55646.1 hypothetical protein KK1_001868 [Cajanus cajan]
MVDVDGATSESPKRHPSGLLLTLSSILALISKRAGRMGGSKPKPKPKPKASDETDLRVDPNKPKSRPKKLLSNISSKAFHKKSPNPKEEKESAEAWGNGGVWQKEILMGDKCEPLDFSGVIYYDGNGKQLSQIPLRSPRASPLPGYLTRRPLK